jgi:hypothetical protein
LTEKYDIGEIAEIMLLEHENKVLNDLAAKGEIMHVAVKAIAEEQAGHAFEIEIDGQKGYAVDAPAAIANEVADALRARGDGFALCYTQRVDVDGKPVIKASFRSQEGCADVSLICKARGGGGNLRTAACVISLEEFQEILRSVEPSSCPKP